MKARLDALGYDCGAGDAFDRQTAWAIRWFRRQNGLADGGRIVNLHGGKGRRAQAAVFPAPSDEREQQHDHQYGQRKKSQFFHENAPYVCCVILSAAQMRLCFIIEEVRRRVNRSQVQEFL